MQLTKRQYQAVCHENGPCMVLAGPGSGKTLTMVRRIENLIKEYGVSGRDILAVTFTRDAKSEMESRFFYLMGGELPDVSFVTFHSLFLEILRAGYGLNSDSVLSEGMTDAIFRHIIKEMSIETANINHCVYQMARLIGRVKNGGPLWDDREAAALPFTKDEFPRIYKRYEEMKKRLGQMDYDDMPLETRRLFRERPEVLEKWQQRYKYILVDEFQDINALQLEILRDLSKGHGNLFVVGDDDQSVYRFRGALPGTMRQFENLYPECKRIVLDTNFRSQGTITKGALEVISHNRERYPKDIVNVKPPGKDIRIQICADPVAESTFVVKRIKALQAGKQPPSVGIIYRSKKDAISMMAALTEHRIPFYMKDMSEDIYKHYLTLDVTSYLRLAQGARERKLFLQVMNRPDRYISRECVTKARCSFQEIGAHYCHQKVIRDGIKKWETDTALLGEMAPYAAIRYLGKEMGYEEYLSVCSKSSGTPLSTLQLVFNEIMERAKPFPDIQSWLNHVARVKATVKKSKVTKKEKEGIQLRTMHGAKGLEFDIVFILGANEGIIPYRRAELPEETEEERRLFYVAMTRAKEALYITCLNERNGKTLMPSRFLSELQAAPFGASYASSSSSSSSSI